MMRSPEAIAQFSSLTAAEVSTLADLLSRQRSDYIEHFHPFQFSPEAIAAQLFAAKADRFWSIRHQGQLAGLFMLRGFDEGFTRPSFGVFVAEEFSGRGLARAALAYAIQWCRGNGIRRMMLKVAPDNPAAHRVYSQAGFKNTGICKRTNHEIMELDLNDTIQ